MTAEVDLWLERGLAPYRVEWRANLTTRWLLVEVAESRAVADSAAVAQLDRFGGYARLISQHVIAASPRPGAWEVAP